ncbi:glycoside hydrolase family 27 protein [Heterobasidion irregulare TC 32-1]|uniref:Alpha-galactosidase n=1 Tax=Heterobasidion irregulare (strain TC 32-1) TaxID=747525 RepID=W4JYT3_HETIT|nr:glycoside hydrolase family 27 protein [Heterobasidion irregulare TC 32-1]ETW78250.1 glycoside hydrolase family 27 protein [Heterobasidion irregulare TC 32-1]
MHWQKIGTTTLKGLALLQIMTGVSPVQGLANGIARLPGELQRCCCDIDEDLILTTAKLMKSLGLQDAGYTYVNLDDCWAEKNRTSADRVRFKSGMKNLTTQIRRLGFDSGWFTCAGYPGSFEHEQQDAQTFFVDWGFDYLKFDNCAKYQRMADAINAVSQQSHVQIVYSLCEWGWVCDIMWGASMAHSWRTTGDIGPNWASLTNIINFNSFITQATGFYGRNDLDMVSSSCNGGLTYDEAKSHFTAWALMKSPLLIGTNLSAITDDILGILKNREILAINQDPVKGSSISPFRWGINPDWTSNSTYPAQYWSGPSQNGTVFMLARRI